MSPAQSLSLSPSSSSRGLNIGLWVAQVLLAVVFLMAGATKLALPIEALTEQMPWVSGAMGGAVRYIGIAEVLGALGLILPAATRIAPRLTGLAAGGLTTVMLFAAILHLSRGEAPMVAVNATLGGLGAFIAWGRLFGAPIAPRS